MLKLVRQKIKKIYKCVSLYSYPSLFLFLVVSLVLGSFLFTKSLEALGFDKIRSLLSSKCIEMMSKDGSYSKKPLQANDRVMFGEASIIEQDGKYGIISNEGTIIVEARYDSIILDDEVGVRYIVEESGKYGLIDFYGKKLIDVEYEFLESTGVDSFYIVKKDSKYGTVDIKNKVFIPIIYDRIEVLKHELYKVSLDSKVGVVNALGKNIVPIGYDDIEVYPEFNFVVKKDHKYGMFVGSSLILGSSFDDISNLSKGYFRFKKDGRSGLIYGGNIILGRIFDSISLVNRNVFLVSRYKKFGLVKYVNNEMVFILDPEFDSVELLDRSWSDWGYLRSNDDYRFMEVETDDGVISFSKDFYERDIVIVKKKDKVGLIKINYNQKEDNWILEPIYDRIDVIDKYVVATSMYSDSVEIDVPMSKYFIAEKDGVSIILDEKGTVIYTAEDNDVIFHWGSLDRNLKKLCSSRMTKRDLRKIQKNEARSFIIVSKDKSIKIFIDER